MQIQQTSREAYESVGRGCNSLHDRLLESLVDENYTCDELEVLLDAKHQSMSAQIRKGVLDGDIEDTGDKRPTRSNRQAIVWALRIENAVEHDNVGNKYHGHEL